MILTKTLKRRLLALSCDEALFSRRGFFESSTEKRQTYETIGFAFINGFNCFLKVSNLIEFDQHFRRCRLEHQGFFVEGAAMAAKLSDGLSLFGSSTFAELHDKYQNRFTYLLLVGFGWAIPRLAWLRWRLQNQLDDLQPMLKYLAIDGYGFHQGFFTWRKSLMQNNARKRLPGYNKNAFDQGLGRSLLFISGGNVFKLSELVSRFPPERRADLWSGIGLALGYAGGVTNEESSQLLRFAGSSRFNLGQGVCFAAEARMLAGNVVQHTEDACNVVCHMSVEDAANLTRNIRDRINAQDSNAYEQWRMRIAAELKNQIGVIPA